MAIAFVALAAGAVSITAAAAASHAPLPKLQDATVPSWSPDGKQILFVYTPRTKFGRPLNRYRVVRTSSNPGGALHTVLRSPGHCCVGLQWAADGRILVNPSGGLKSTRVQGGEPKQLAFPSCGTSRNPWGCSTAGFILSPDREYAAASITDDPSDPHSSYGIGLVQLRPGLDPVVRSTPLAMEETSGVFDTARAFSPDGTQLVFTRWSSWDGWSGGPPAVRAIGVGGGGSVPLAQSGIPGASLVPNDANELQWSPDGRWVGYIEYDGAGGQNLEVVPTTGASTPQILATCSSYFQFSWSPTSTLLEYDCESYSEESSQFMTVRPDGTQRTDLLKGRNLIYDQALSGGRRWSPDGSRLLFVAHGRSNDVDHVWTIRPDGSHLTRHG